MKILSAVLVAAVILASSATCEAGRVFYSLGGGSVSRYESGDYIRFDATGLAGGALGWRWSQRVSLEIDAGYLRFTGAAPIFYTYPALGPLPPPPQWAVSVFPLAVGAVGYLRGEGAITPYAAVSPALYWIRWSLDEGGPFPSDFTRLVPGLRAGLGQRFPIGNRLRLDLGAVYLLSGSGRIASPQMRSLAAQDRFAGLNQLVPFGQLTLTP